MWVMQFHKNLTFRKKKLKITEFCGIYIYAVVTDSTYDGAPFEEVANGNHETQYVNNFNNDFSVKKCSVKKCKTCEYFVTSYVYNSNHSKKCIMLLTTLEKICHVNLVM